MTNICFYLMWITLTLLSFLLNFIQAVPAPGREAPVGYCNTNRDCSKGECCVRFSLPQGKRGASELSRFTRGMCQKLGIAGSGCLVNNQQSANDIFYQSCPCGRKLICKENDTITVPLGQQGTCQLKPCSSPDNCAIAECCVSNVRPTGKHSTDQTKRDVPPGHCEQMGRGGARCLDRNGSGRPKDKLVFDFCPCFDHLICEGTGEIDFNLGAIGKCKWPYKRG